MASRLRFKFVKNVFGVLQILIRSKFSIFARTAVQRGLTLPISADMLSVAIDKKARILNAIPLVNLIIMLTCKKKIGGKYEISQF